MFRIVGTALVFGGLGLWLGWALGWRERDRQAGFPRTRRRYRRSV